MGIGPYLQLVGSDLLDKGKGWRKLLLGKAALQESYWVFHQSRSLPRNLHVLKRSAWLTAMVRRRNKYFWRTKGQKTSWVLRGLPGNLQSVQEKVLATAKARGRRGKVRVADVLRWPERSVSVYESDLVGSGNSSTGVVGQVYWADPDASVTWTLK